MTNINQNNDVSYLLIYFAVDTFYSANTKHIINVLVGYHLKGL